MTMFHGRPPSEAKILEHLRRMMHPRMRARMDLGHDLKHTMPVGYGLGLIVCCGVRGNVDYGRSDDLGRLNEQNEAFVASVCGNYSDATDSVMAHYLGPHFLKFGVCFSVGFPFVSSECSFAAALSIARRYLAEVDVSATAEKSPGKAVSIAYGAFRASWFDLVHHLQYTVYSPSIKWGMLLQDDSIFLEGSEDLVLLDETTFQLFGRSKEDFLPMTISGGPDISGAKPHDETQGQRVFVRRWA